MSALTKATARVTEVFTGGAPERRRSLWSLVGLVGRALLASVGFVALARSLGDEGYGVYVGVIAYMGLLAPMASLGVGEVLTKRVARNPAELREAWGNAIAVTVVVGGLLFLTMLALSVKILPGRDTTLIALFGGVEFLSVGVIHIVARASTALDRYAAYALIHIVDAGARSMVAVGFWLLGGDDIRVLAVAMVIAMAIGALGTSLWLQRVDGSPTIVVRDLVPAAREGSQFALGDASNTIQGGVDKTMLLRAGFDADTGLYGAGVRLITYALLPASAIFSAAYPEFFRRGANGVGAARAYSAQIRPKVLTATVGGSLLFLVFSPVAGVILGGEFDGVVPVVAAMVAYPLLRGLQVLTADILSGTGRQAYRSKSQFSTALLNVALNIVLIPEYSWKGAVAATYVSELVFLGLLMVGVRNASAAEASQAPLEA